MKKNKNITNFLPNLAEAIAKAKLLLTLAIAILLSLKLALAKTKEFSLNIAKFKFQASYFLTKLIPKGFYLLISLFKLAMNYNITNSLSNFFSNLGNLGNASNSFAFASFSSYCSNSLSNNTIDSDFNLNYSLSKIASLHKQLLTLATGKNIGTVAVSKESNVSKLSEQLINKNKKILNYNFNSSNNNKQGLLDTKAIQQNKYWYLPEDLNKIISAFFKSIYCLISKPKFIHSNDKIIIEILYYITIPDYNIFKWHNFIYNPNNYNINNSNKSNNSNNSNKSNQEDLLLAKVQQDSNELDKKGAKLMAIAYASNSNNKINKVRRNKSIKTIIFKNYLIKKTLFNLNNSNIANIYFNKFNIFFNFLSSYFRKPIEFNLIRIHKSEYDVNILAQLFILILKKKNIRIAINKLYNKNNNTNLNKQDKDNNYIPAIISGIYIHIGGRLMREPIIPRLTTKKFEKGAIATGKVNFLDSARITKKNKKGAYTIKIAYAQNLVK